jgi:hypothetical protein
MPVEIWAWKPEILLGEYTASSTPLKNAVKFVRADLVEKMNVADLTPKWQSIDSCPRGRSILVMTTMAKAGRPNEICVVANSMWHEREDGSGLWLDLEGIMSQDAPEYWMDIPPPPATTTKEKHRD